MGIRYEKDQRRATNGPLIFFSILKDEAFEEEIRNAVYSGLSFYAYRFPGDQMLTFGSAEGFEEGVSQPGFVIGFFNPDLPVITIPYKGTHKNPEAVSFYSFPEKSTSKDEYCREVEEIISTIKSGEGEKVVASRVEVLENDSFDIADKFYELCNRFPEAFVFSFSTPATGCWIGASPELLLKSKEGNIETMALAGTRPSDSREEWDFKNIREQEIVADYVAKTLKNHGLQAEKGETFNLKTGLLEHICTPIKAVISDRNSFNLERLLKNLSPTPALCGFPKEFAMNEIGKLEKHDRGCYGGFCGPFHSKEDFSFNVVIRCASLTEKKISLYAGGGIISSSLPAQEWEETEMKLNSFRSL